MNYQDILEKLKTREGRLELIARMAAACDPDTASRTSTDAARQFLKAVEMAAKEQEDLVDEALVARAVSLTTTLESGVARPQVATKKRTQSAPEGS